MSAASTSTGYDARYFHGRLRGHDANRSLLSIGFWATELLRWDAAFCVVAVSDDEGCGGGESEKRWRGNSARPRARSRASPRRYSKSDHLIELQSDFLGMALSPDVLRPCLCMPSAKHPHCGLHSQYSRRKTALA